MLFQQCMGNEGQSSQAVEMLGRVMLLGVINTSTNTATKHKPEMHRTRYNRQKKLQR